MCAGAFLVLAYFDFGFIGTIVPLFPPFHFPQAHLFLLLGHFLPHATSWQIQKAKGIRSFPPSNGAFSVVLSIEGKFGGRTEKSQGGDKLAGRIASAYADSVKVSCRFLPAI